MYDNHSYSLEVHLVQTCAWTIACFFPKDDQAKGLKTHNTTDMGHKQQNALLISHITPYYT